VVTTSSENEKAYSFLGETSIGDGIHRLDVFEFVGSTAIRGCLLEAARSVAASRGISSLRFRSHAKSEIANWLKQAGCSKNGEFFFMGKMFGDETTVREHAKERKDDADGRAESEGKLGSSVQSEKIMANFSNKGAYFHSDYA